MSEQEEFEFRARAEAEAAQEKKSAQATATAPGSAPVDPSMMSQATDFVTQTAIPMAYGLGSAGASLVAEHPLLAGAGAAALFPKTAAKIPGVGAAIDLGRGAIDAANAYSASKNVTALSQLEHQARQYLKMGQQVPQGLQSTIDSMRARVSPPVPSTPTPTPAPAAAPTPTAQQPGVMQRGMDIASKMRQFAAQRVLPVAGTAGVLGGVAAVPGAMMMDAYKNYQTQTPEQRRESAMQALSGQGLGQAGIY